MLTSHRSVRVRVALVALSFALSSSVCAVGQQRVGTSREYALPHVVLVAATPHYSPAESLPRLAERLEARGMRTTLVIADGDPEHNKNQVGVPGLEVLSDPTVDVAVFFMRFLELPQEQLDYVLQYVQSGKPVVGLRTSTHAFAYPDGDERAVWNAGFGRDVLGSPYFIHLQGGTEVRLAPESAEHPLLAGVTESFEVPSTLYKAELQPGAVPLLIGRGHSNKVGTVTNDFGTHELAEVNEWPIAWTWRNQWGGPVFATTLGHPDDFKVDSVMRLLTNGVVWAIANRPFSGVTDAGADMPLADLHDLEVERQSFELLPGFEVNLFAAEPMLVNPIHMTWDPEGRLWVACSWSYPQLLPGDEPNDKIIILEDTDGDGRADKSTVFAEGLYVPTGLELGDGGVYVASAPDLLFLKDTDGDGHADHREVVLTGFATEDNHHSISAWRWGPGGWLYFQEGTFLHSQVETPHGTVRLQNGGVFQYRPRQQRLNVFADYRASNPWGHTFDRWGQSILIDNPRLYFLAPLTANSRAKLAYEPSGSGTKQCGGEIVSGRHLPEEYRGQIWTNQYKAHTVARYQIVDDGAGVSIQNLEPLMVSSGDYFRPVDLKIGPDGAAYVLDWYNPLIGHMQHSFRDPRRDKSHGRVWRVTYKDRPLVERPKLVGRPLPELLDHLKDPEDGTRYQVKRVLYDTPAESASAALAQWEATLDPADAEFEHHRLEALWCYQTIDVVNEPLLKQVLSSKEPKARAAAVRVIRYWHDSLADPLALLATAMADEHPRVRLEAVLSLSYVPDPKSVVLAVRAIDQPTDRFLDHALRLTVDGLQPIWLAEYRAGRLEFDSIRHRNYALGNLVSDEAVATLVEILNSGGFTAKDLEGPVAAVAQSATANQLEPLVLSMIEATREQAVESIPADGVTMILDAMERAARVRKAIPKTNLDSLIGRCYGIDDLSAQVATTRLIGAWKVQGEGRRLERFITAADTPDELRRAAAESLGEIGGRANERLIESLLASSAPLDQRYWGAVALAAADVNAAADRAAALLAIEPGSANPVPVVMAFANRKSGADALAAALEKSPANADVAARVMLHLNQIGEQHAGLVKAFSLGVPTVSLEEQLLNVDVMQLAAEIREHGDAARGELVFRRADLTCTSCHGFAGAGPAVGPDLSAIGSSSPPDYLVDAILRPSKVIKEFYESVTIVTLDGRVINGRLAYKGDDQVSVYDAAELGKLITIPMSNIDELVPTKTSLMPTGLVNKMTRLTRTKTS